MNMTDSDSYETNSCFDQTHSTLLVNLGQFFFDSIHTEDRLLYKETNNFLKFFKEFSKEHISADSFEKDPEMKTIRFKDKILEKTMMCMFEGLTRKIPAFNYLKFVYAGPFSKINLFSIEQDLINIYNKENQKFEV